MQGSTDAWKAIRSVTYPVHMADVAHGPSAATAYAPGRVIVNVLPFPNALSTAMDP